MIKRLLFNDALVAFIMLALIVTNYQARDLARGTPNFIDRARGLDFLAAWLFLSAGALLYNTLRGRPSTRWAFAFFTLPLAFYIAATVVYSFVTPGTAKSGIVIYGGFYVLLLKRAWMRPRHIGADDDQ